MNTRKRLLAPLLLLFLCACGQAQGEPEPEPEPTPPPPPVIAVPAPAERVPEFVNPLTGLEIEEAYLKNRPLAVMLNNLKEALPQHGISQADIIYEVPAEGGITRMLAVFQSVEGLGEIGSIRSTRPYYLELALGMDAILLHAGGSEQAYSDIRTLGLTALDCIRGPYEGTLYWRDRDRAKSAGFEHSVFTSGEKISELFPDYSFRQTHEEGYEYPMSFTGDGTPADGESARTISVRFSTYKTGVFQYDEETKRYRVWQYDAPYLDGNTGEQLCVTNVLTLFTDLKVLDGEGRLHVHLTGEGTGRFACGGKAVEIIWSKASAEEPFLYTLADGTPLTFGQGTTYVNIVSANAAVTVE